MLCPFCRVSIPRPDVTTMPNNRYALHLLKLEAEKVACNNNREE